MGHFAKCNVCKCECFRKAGVSFFKMLHDFLCFVSIPPNTVWIWPKASRWLFKVPRKSFTWKVSNKVLAFKTILWIRKDSSWRVYMVKGLQHGLSLHDSPWNAQYSRINSQIEFPRFHSIFGLSQRAWWRPSSWGVYTALGGGGVRRGSGREGWKGGFQDLTMKLLRLGLALLDSSDCWLQQSCWDCVQM